MKTYLKPTENFHNAVETTLDRLPEAAPVRRHIGRRFAALGVAAALTLAIGVGASSLIKYQNSWSSAEPDFTELPSQQEMEERFGYPYKAVEKFSNGFEFAGGFVTHNETYGEGGDHIGNYDSLSCEYERGDQYLTLMTSLAVGENATIEGDVAETYNGLDFFYKASTFFLVPDDKVITEDDERALVNGEYSFSFGEYEPTEEEAMEIRSGESRAVFSLINSDNQFPAIRHQKSVQWIDDGRLYRILYVGAKNMDKAELLGMAKEIIG
ncbi:MAG: hypothetical protein J1F63_06190 [Oscillospiraceae bacterium]|nr:hypothetical protein [Oscillospiraceae bacterium]